MMKKHAMKRTGPSLMTIAHGLFICLTYTCTQEFIHANFWKIKKGKKKKHKSDFLDFLFQFNGAEMKTDFFLLLLTCSLYLLLVLLKLLPRTNFESNAFCALLWLVFTGQKIFMQRIVNWVKWNDSFSTWAKTPFNCVFYYTTQTRTM